MEAGAGAQRDPYGWYWSNYKTGMDWIKKHEIAYWKSQALAYRAENTHLLQTLHDLHANTVTTAPHHQSLNPTKSSTPPMTKVRKPKRKKKRNSKSNKSTQSESDFEVTPELVDFFRKSLKHKEDCHKEKEKLCSLSSFLPPQEILELRQKEMKELYGDGSAKILGMETVMTLAFDRFIDQKNPEYWPVLPLNL